jgi:flagellar L-ring protein precursor FlgH
MRVTSFVLTAVVAGGVLGAMSPRAMGQNLFDPPPPSTPSPTSPAPAAPAGPGGTEPGPGTAPGPEMVATPPVSNEANPAGQALAGLSMFSVNPPPPRRYAKHDLVEVIVNETSVQKFAQTYDNKKDYDLSAELAKFPSLKALIESATLEDGIGAERPGIGVTSKNKFKGEGKFSRNDQVTSRLTATVLDVKPNGTLVLEARETIQSGKETSTMVLSGIARQEDITRNNTVQSGQLASLNIKIEHSGDIKDTAEKGLIPRVLETIFNF